jgi:hypothetical protein
LAGVVDWWLHIMVDLIFTACYERILERSQYMFSPKVILWGGVAGVFSGMFWLMMGLAPESGGVSGVLALVLGLGGLVSLYSRQARQGGKLGLAGFALGIIGTLLALATQLWGFTSGRLSPSTLHTEPALVAPTILILSLAFVIVGAGLALLGVASLLAKTLHRWRGLPLSVGLLSALNGVMVWLVYYLPMSQGRDPWATWPPEGYGLSVAALVLLGLGWMGLGITLATEVEAQVVQTPPASV